MSTIGTVRASVASSWFSGWIVSVWPVDPPLPPSALAGNETSYWFRVYVPFASNEGSNGAVDLLTSASRCVAVARATRTSGFCVAAPARNASRG